MIGQHNRHADRRSNDARDNPWTDRAVGNPSLLTSQHITLHQHQLPLRFRWRGMLSPDTNRRRTVRCRQLIRATLRQVNGKSTVGSRSPVFPSIGHPLAATTHPGTAGQNRRPIARATGSGSPARHPRHPRRAPVCPRAADSRRALPTAEPGSSRPVKETWRCGATNCRRFIGRSFRGPSMQGRGIVMKK